MYLKIKCQQSTSSSPQNHPHTNYSRQRSIAIKPRFKSSIKFKKNTNRFSDIKQLVDLKIVKELDEETGLYYYGARYLDPRTSRWLTGDPAIYQGDYIPVAPINDDARKHNQNLPGMGGIFNIVNMHAYHYAGNNPVKYVDPDGRRFIISGDRQFRRQVRNDLMILERNLRRSGDREALRKFLEIKRDKNFIVEIKYGDENSYNFIENTITYNPLSTEGGIDESGSNEVPTSSGINLGHEVGHAIDHRNGNNAEFNLLLETGEITLEDYHYLREDSAINFENSVRSGYFGNDERRRRPARESHIYSYPTPILLPPLILGGDFEW